MNSSTKMVLSVVSEESKKKKSNIEHKSKRPPSEDTNSEIRSSMACFCGIVISQEVRKALL